jgi:hypothetical protein
VNPLPADVTIRNQPHRLEVFNQPLPLVAEARSPSIGNDDVDEKLPPPRQSAPTTGPIIMAFVHALSRTGRISPRENERARRRPPGGAAVLDAPVPD